MFFLNFLFSKYKFKKVNFKQFLLKNLFSNCRGLKFNQIQLHVYHFYYEIKYNYKMFINGNVWFLKINNNSKARICLI